MHDNLNPQTTPLQKPVDASMRPPLPPAPPAPAPKPPSVPPPPAPPPPPPPTTSKSQHAPPPPPVPSVNPSVSNVTMSLQNPQVTHGNALPSASSAYASPSRQQRQPPPPPPPANEDFGIEEDVK